MFDISIQPNFNKFWKLLILGQIWAEEVVNISSKLFLTLRKRSAYLEY